MDEKTSSTSEQSSMSELVNNATPLMITFGLLGLTGLFGSAVKWDARGGYEGTSLFARVMTVVHTAMRWIVGVAVFLFSWGWAVSSWGWLLGLGLGWIPAGFVGLIAAFTWWVACYAIFFFLLLAR
jgi:hypothetical protein